MTAFIVHVEIRVKIGTEKQFLRRAQEHRKNVLSNEPKCRCFDISVEESAPQNFRLYEVYDDLEAFKNTWRPSTWRNIVRTQSRG